MAQALLLARALPAAGVLEPLPDPLQALARVFMASAHRVPVSAALVDRPHSRQRFSAATAGITP